MYAPDQHPDRQYMRMSRMYLRVEFARLRREKMNATQSFVLDICRSVPPDAVKGVASIHNKLFRRKHSDDSLTNIREQHLPFSTLSSRYLWFYCMLRSWLFYCSYFVVGQTFLRYVCKRSLCSHIGNVLRRY